MRKASAAIVPLLMAIMLLFWFIMYWGGASETLQALNSVGHLQKIQQKLVIPSVRYYCKTKAEAQQTGATLSKTELEMKTNLYVKHIMVSNNIEK